jgi:hypothetical protein
LDLRGRKWREAGEDCIMKSFITSTLNQALLGHQNEDEMGRTRSTYKLLVEKPERKRPETT